MPSKNAAASAEFAVYCCELLKPIGPCVSKRMFGGYGISLDGLTIAILADLGDGDKLYLKADDATRAEFEAAGCARFTYDMKGEPKSMNYYTAPLDAMESPQVMLPWARLALNAALNARATKPVAKRKPAAKPEPAPKRSVVKLVAKPASKTAAATGRRAKAT